MLVEHDLPFSYVYCVYHFLVCNTSRMFFWWICPRAGGKVEQPVGPWILLLTLLKGDICLIPVLWNLSSHKHLSEITDSGLAGTSAHSLSTQR